MNLNPSATPNPETLDPSEVARFAAMAREWWDPRGKFRPLHQLGPARMTFVRDQILSHFKQSGICQSTAKMKPLAGLTVLDVGCGGGLVSEPLARMGASVTGIEPAEANIAAARSHANDAGLAIEYRAVRVEDLATQARQFDVVVCLEVIEHVPDVRRFLRIVASLVRPGGLLIVSTLNRTLKSYMLAIIGAEYVLRWLPAGTHQWDRFVMPDELHVHLSALGLDKPTFAGLVYSPFQDDWSLNPTDLDVNYLAAAAKPPTK